MDIVNNFLDFFAPVNALLNTDHQLIRLFGRSNNVWNFLDLKDVLTLSATSSSISSKVCIDQGIAHALLVNNNKCSQVCKYKLNFESSSISIGALRSILHHVVVTARTAVLTVDLTGTVSLNLGRINKNIFNTLDFLTTLGAFKPFGEEKGVTETELDDGDNKIEKFLEISSVDEFDDFKPRHPHPRDKTHRRGDSYFNSDIAETINNVDTLELQSFAKEALDSLDEPLISDVTTEKPFLSPKSKILQRKSETENSL